VKFVLLRKLCLTRVSVKIGFSNIVLSFRCELIAEPQGMFNVMFLITLSLLTARVISQCNNSRTCN